MAYKDSRMSLAMWFQTVVVVVQINEVNWRERQRLRITQCREIFTRDGSEVNPIVIQLELGE